MPQSPLNSDVVTFSILIKGQEIDIAYQILEIHVNRSVNKIASASFTLIADNQDTFKPSDSDSFIPGKKVEIQAGYSSKNKSIFKGIITGHGVAIKGNQRIILEVNCMDSALMMTNSQQSALYKEHTDSSIMKQVIKKYPLSAAVEQTNFVHPISNQYQVSDWDFLISRANANGMLVNTQDGQLIIEKIQANGVADLALTYGHDVYEFEGKFDVQNQVPSIRYSSWDDSQQKSVEVTAEEPAQSKFGDFDNKKIVDNIRFQGTDLHTDVPIPKEALVQWSNAQLTQSRADFFRGSISFQGNHLPKLNTLIELKDFGKRYSGMALITGIQHELKEGNWITTVKFGLDKDFSLQKLGQHSHAQGLHIGIVKKIHEDPNDSYRVLVHLPNFKESKQEIWARLSNGYATNNGGIFFYPEVNDEVIISFLENDPQFPIIIGSVFNKKNTPPIIPDEKNSRKGIISKSNIQITFDDEDKILTLTTPNKQKIQLSDKDKMISLKDSNGNIVELSNSGIVLNSAKDISINAKGKIDIKASQKIDITTSTGDINLQGLNVKTKAKMAFEASGAQSAKVNSTGQTIIKGAIVMIN